MILNTGNSQKPRLSVILPNYNFGQYLREALDAIFSQSYSPYEVLVIDDGSTDDSVSIIKDFQKRHANLRFFQNEKNMGTVYSVKRCFDNATGDYMYFAASDDKVLPGFFEKSMGLLYKFPQAGLCCTDLEVIINGKEINDRACLSRVPRYFNSDETLKLFLTTSFTPYRANTCIIKREALLEAGGFIPSLKWSCDSFAYNIICFRYGMCYIPEVLTMVRFHEGQYGASNAKQPKLEREVIRNMMDLIQMPQYADVLPYFEKTAPFSVYPWEVLMVALSDQKYRKFLSSKLLRFALIDKLVNRGIKEPLKKILPDNVQDLYRRYVAKSM